MTRKHFPVDKCDPLVYKVANVQKNTEGAERGLEARNVTEIGL